MKTVNSLRISVVLLGLSMIVFSQTSKSVPVTDLNGKWTLVKTEAENSFVGRLVNQASRNCTVTLVIEHHEPEIKLRMSSICLDVNPKGQPYVEKSEETYYTDERGEINSYIRNMTVSSVTRWKGETLEIADYKTSSDSANKSKTKPFRTVKFSLSGDKNTLTELIDDSGNGSSNSVAIRQKRVYKREK